MKAEFDSTYPIHLNGIISRDEYRQSINRINLPISSNRISLILAMVFGLSIVIGMAFIIIGGATQDNSKTGQFPPLIGVAMALFAGGSMFILIGLCIIQFRRTARMREIIAEESMKYSSRSPIPCSWRLEITTHCFGGYEDDHNSRLVYHVSVFVLYKSSIFVNRFLLVL
jgi:hypothetical protein